MNKVKDNDDSNEKHNYEISPILADISIDAGSSPKLMQKKAKKKHKKKKSIKSHYDNIQICPEISIDVEKLIHEEEKKCENEEDVDIGTIINMKSDIPFAIHHNETYGRHAIARKPNIQVGELLAIEKPWTWFVSQSYIRSICSSCSHSIENIQPIGCLECKQSWYCSKSCLNQDTIYHQPKCNALKNLIEICTKHNAQPDLARSLIAVLVTRYLDINNKSSFFPGPTSFRARIRDFEEMASHIEDISMENLQSQVSLAESLISLMPIEYRISAHQAVEFTSKVNSNCHELLIGGEAGRRWGIGLFPLCSLFNHSCSPNAVFVNDGSNLVYRIINEVKAGNPICVNYIGIYQGRRSRRYELLNSKHFLCQCHRCLMSPHNENEREKFNNDQYLSGILCDKCQGSDVGIYREISLDEEIFQCSKCKTRIEIKELEEIELKAQNICDRAYKIYNSWKAKNINSQSALNQIENHLASISKLVHANHRIIYESLLPLINLTGALNDHLSRLNYCRRLISMADKALPFYFPPRIPALRCLAVSLISLANKPKQSKVVINKYRNEAKQALETVVNITRIAHGVDNILYSNTIKELEQYYPYRKKN